MLLLQCILKILWNPTDDLKAILRCLCEKSAYFYLEADFGRHIPTAWGKWRVSGGTAAIVCLLMEAFLLANEKPDLFFFPSFFGQEIAYVWIIK